MTTEVEWGRVNFTRNGEEVFVRGDKIDPVALEENKKLSERYNRGRLELWFEVKDKGGDGAIVKYRKAVRSLPTWVPSLSVEEMDSDEVIVAPGGSLTEKITDRGKTIGFRVKHSVPSK